MAKTFLDIHPSARLIVLESEHTVGGTWAKARLYPGLKTNNLYGSLGFSDFPMDEGTFGVKEGEFIPGQVVYKYLSMYAEKFGIMERIRFGSWVNSVERKGGEKGEGEGKGWVVRYAQGGNIAEAEIAASKLVLATGLTFDPFVPRIEGSDAFDTPLFHAKKLAEMVPSTSKTAKTVTILGGSKSAYDAAYAYASQGIPVDWVIRESGNGPVWMSPPYVTPLKKRLDQLTGVRFLTWFSPCIWGDNDGFGGIRRFFHNTVIGRWLVDTFWKILANDVITLNQFDKHPETKKLKPWIPAFWIAAALSILNYPTNIYEYVRNGTIRVHVADVTHLSRKTVHLSNGEALPSDALILSTGWKHRTSIKFLPEGIEKDLGLPHSSRLSHDNSLVRKADQQILDRFPRLKFQPIQNELYKPYEGEGSKETLDQPYRLYRFMIPPAYINDRSIAFLGMIQSIHTSSVAQAQALWLTAYFSNRLRSDQPQQITANSDKYLPSGHVKSPSAPSFDENAIRWETMLHTQFGKWRYPAGYGKNYPDMAFDGIPYVDMLLRDLGLRWQRKASRWEELFSPYKPEDYVGLVEEWRRVAC